MRVFINHVDSYTGRALSKVILGCATQFVLTGVLMFEQVLSGAIVGATLEETEEQTSTGELYQVVGTLSGDIKPDWVQDVLSVSYMLHQLPDSKQS